MLQVAERIGCRDFWELTPREFGRRVHAASERRREHLELIRMREDAASERAAWVVATIMNMAGRALPKGRSIRPDELLRPRAEPIADMDEARRRANRRWRRQLKGRRI